MAAEGRPARRKRSGPAPRGRGARPKASVSSNAATSKPPATASLDGRRLGRFFGLLGSVHDDEALAAVRAADAFVQRLGLTWADMLTRSYAPPPRIDDTIRLCLDWAAGLTAWEQHFVRSLANQR